MKFGQYLEQNLTPEWRRAYIDYKGCKKRIKIVDARLKNKGSPGAAAVAIASAGNARRERQEGNGENSNEDDDDSSDNDGDHGPAAKPKKSTPSLRGGSFMGTPKISRSWDKTGKSPGTKPNSQAGSSSLSPRAVHPSSSQPPPLDIGEPSVTRTTSGPGRSRSNTVAFASGSNQRDGGPALSRSPGSMSVAEDMEGEGTAGTHRDNERMDSGASDGSRSSEPAGPSTPLVGAGTPNTPFGRSSRSAKSPRFALGGNGLGGRSSVTTSPILSAVRPVVKSIRSMSISSPYIPPRSAPTFDELYETLESDEKAFFDFLESELQKVESFYLARQEEALKRGKELKVQLNELAEHRRLYHEFYPGSLPKWESTVERFLPGVGSAAAHATVTGVANAAQRLQQRLPHGAGNYGSEDRKNASEVESQVGATRRSEFSERDKKQFSADRYTKYKHELRKATLEYYRNLEIIKNYRILNVTGFRKALKKFEKTTRIHCLEMFTTERISMEAFAKGETIETMLKTVEELFTEHFEHGDTKKARDRLRKQDYVNTHYTSVFRSGLMMGVGLPIAIISLVRALEIRTEISTDKWNAMLQVYGGLYIPVIFALLFELNLDAFVSARINYEFVMELSRPVVDFRSYMEIPAFLFLTLSVCMYFTFFQIGFESVDPTTWPAAWLVFVAVFFLNPLPIFRRRSRYWLLRVLWRVITPGWSRVEFIAFFIADELNSLVYPLGNILFLSCGYANSWPANTYAVCPSGSRWPYILIYAAPASIRLIQCLKRYFDSSLKIHLINAGKYSTSVAQYAMFVWWRNRGSNIPDNVFIGWVIVATIASTYTCSWDIIVDWSLLRPGAQGLRKDRGYQSRFIYYFAMFTNLIIRFIFVWYLPNRAANVRLRSFIFALLEMCRRWQWNFFRVETEHLGNADAYRVTREIPLPYRRLDPDSEEEAELAAEHESVTERWGKLKKKFNKRPDTPGSRGGKTPGTPDLDNGPRSGSGGQGQRAYEAGHTDDEGGLGSSNTNDRGWEGLLKRIRKGGDGVGDGNRAVSQV